jgi:AcrR family transcriptional regulator
MKDASRDASDNGQHTVFVRLASDRRSLKLAGERVKDRRIEKTQSLLRQALVSLIHEKDYDTIAVKEILDRANVGKSTFYTYFRDKDDLLISGIHDILHRHDACRQPPAGEPYEKIIWFSTPIFEYLDQHRQRGEVRKRANGRVIHEHLQEVLSEMISDDLKKSIPRRQSGTSRVPLELLVEYIASTFILVLNWWVEGSDPVPAGEVNELFRAFVRPTLAGIWEKRGI